MKSIAARAAKNGFGHLIDLARAEPIMIEKHGRPVVVVLAVEEFERLKGRTANEKKETHRARVTRDR